MQKSRLFKTFWLIGIILSACTSPPEKRMPPPFSLHLPVAMGLKGESLLVSSSVRDGKYDMGWLIGLNTSGLAQNKGAIAFRPAVSASVLVPPDTSQIIFSDNLAIFVSRFSDQLIALPTINNKLTCTEPGTVFSDCPGVMQLKLSAQDPYSLKLVSTSAQKDVVAISYLTSDRIDMVAVNKTSQLMELIKSISIYDLVKEKMDKKFDKNRLIARKIDIFTDNAGLKLYILLEEHLKKTDVLTKPKASYLLAMAIDDALASPKPAYELIKLTKDLAIVSATDFYIDAVAKQLYILGRMPEVLYKINLTNNQLIKQSNVCSAAASFAISPQKDLIVVPCLEDKQVAAYSMSSLNLTHVSKNVADGPAYVVIDEARNQIYCSSMNDSVVVVFNDQLQYMGHIFEKTSDNRAGF